MQGIEDIVEVDDLRQAIAYLTAKLDKEEQKERLKKIAIAKEIVLSLKLSPEDLGFKSTSSTAEIDGPRKKRKTSDQAAAEKERKYQAAKYRDPVTRAHWSERGRMPKFFEGKDLSQYLAK